MRNLRSYMDTTQAPAEATDSSSLQSDGEQHENSQGIDAIHSIEDLERFRTRVLEDGPPPDGDESATEPGEKPEAEAPAEGATDQEAPPEPEAPTPTPEPAPAKNEEEEDDTPLDPDKLATRYRLAFREDDDVGKMAAALKKRNKDWTLEDAMSEARKRLGKQAPAPAPAEQTNPAHAVQPNAEREQTAPVDIAALDAEIKKLKAEKTQAMREVDMEKAAEVEARLDELRDQRQQAIIDARLAKQQAQPPAEAPKPKQVEKPAAPAAAQVELPADYDAKFDASLAQAETLYPFVKDAKSEAARRMQAIDRMLEANGDALFHAADKPLRLARMVAAELGITPASPAPAKPAPRAAVRQPAPANPIASGDSRTTTTRSNTALTVAAIQAIDSPEALDDFLSKVGGTRA